MCVCVCVCVLILLKKPNQIEYLLSPLSSHLEPWDYNQTRKFFKTEYFYPPTTLGVYLWTPTRHQRALYDIKILSRSLYCIRTLW